MQYRFKHLLLETKDEIGYIEIIPNSSNEVKLNLLNELIAGCKILDQEKKIKGIVLSLDFGPVLIGNTGLRSFAVDSLENQKKYLIKLHEVVYTIFRISKPKICLLNGCISAFAFFLSLAADQRFMVEKGGCISLQSNIVFNIVPESFHLLLQSNCGNNYYKLVNNSNEITPALAYQYRLVDRLVPQMSIKKQAEDEIREILNFEFMDLKINNSQQKNRSIEIFEQEVQNSSIENMIAQSFSRNLLNTIDARLY